MRNKQQGEPSASTEVEQGIPQDQQPIGWPDLSVLFSIAALTVSYLGYRRTGKISDINKFDKRYGDDLRAESRKLERHLKGLNAFIYPSQKSVSEQKQELQRYIVDIEESGHAITSILREIDSSADVSGSGWQANFERHSSRSIAIFDGIQGLSDSQDALFANTVKKAQDHWQNAIDQMRKDLEKAKIN